MTGEDLYWAFIDIANGILQGTMLGSYYALLSVGLAITFGVMRLVNLAHGDWLIFGAYLAVVLLQLLPISPFLVIVLVVPLMFALGWVLQTALLNRVSAQRMEEKGIPSNFALMSPILVTFGLSIVVSHLLLALFASDAKVIQNALSYSSIALTQDLSIPKLRLIFFGVVLALMVLLVAFLRLTHLGRAIRAASDDPQIAPLMGMRPETVYAAASGIAMAVAGIAGVMVGMSRTFQPFDGTPYLLVAFGVVILGGLGSILGSLVGGIVLGLTQVLAGTYFGSSAQLVAGYILILAVLAFRPQGLFPR
jgi:branched-chain amino acid transport system permease protein